jgi:hypothetical protein
MMKLTDARAAGLVTAAAFTASAAHIVSVVSETNPLAVALAYPLGIDGLIYVGLRAMQGGRNIVGGTALLIGAAYSLLFNADAENAITMDPLLIAASMPVCFFAAVLIAHTAKPVAEQEAREVVREVPVEVVREVERVVREYPELLPIAPFSTMDVKPRAAVAARKPRAPRIESKVETPGTPGRKVGWDVPKAVALMDEGRSTVEIAGMLPAPFKSIQRARRVLDLVRTTDLGDVEIRAAIQNQLSLATIAAIRKAAK